MVFVHVGEERGRVDAGRGIVAARRREQRQCDDDSCGKSGRKRSCQTFWNIVRVHVGLLKGSGSFQSTNFRKELGAVSGEVHLQLLRLLHLRPNKLPGTPESETVVPSQTRVLDIAGLQSCIEQVARGSAYLTPCARSYRNPSESCPWLPRPDPSHVRSCRRSPYRDHHETCPRFP